MATTPERARETEQRVVAGARRAIELHGWQGATLARVAEQAGLSRMTLHRHGLGREEILQLLVDDYAHDFEQALEPALDAPGSALDRLRSALRAVCDVTERHLPFLRGLDEEADTRLFHERAGEIRSRTAYVSPVERLLHDAVADGSLRPVDVRETATLLVNAADRTYRHLRVAHGWEPDRACQTIDLLCRGLAARESGSGPEA